MKCVIEIRDEVNCRLTGLDPAIRNQLVKKFKIEIPGARYMPAVRLGRWDGTKSFFNAGGVTYINLLPEILPIVDQEGYDIEILDERTYTRDFLFDLVSKDSYVNHKWPQGHTNAGDGIELREHQVSLINQLLSSTQSIYLAATGSGKTLVTASLSERCQKYGRTLVVVPNKSLVVQTERDYQLLGLDVGVWFGDRKDRNKQHTICTWQSLHILHKQTKNQEGDLTIQEFLDSVVAVIVDECHQAKSAVLSELLTGPLSHIPIRWGLTGTIPDVALDKIGLLISIGEVSGSLPAHELQEKGVLSECHVNMLQLQDWGEYTSYQAELKYLLEDADRLRKISELIRGITATGNTLVLLDRVNAGTKLQQLIPQSVFLSGKDSVADRKTFYEEMENTNNQCLLATYGIASTGINIVKIHNVVLIEPGKSFVRTIQSIGRGLRKGFDKDFVNIWDISSTLRYSKRHLTRRKKFYKDSKYPFSLEQVSWSNPKSQR